MVKVSPKQMSKLRNGHKVRVKPPMEGEGCCLIVHPENYLLLSRTFSKNKGAEISNHSCMFMCIYFFFSTLK